MSDCAIRLKAKLSITEAERRRIWAGIYRAILESAARTQKQTAKERTAKDPQTTIPKKKGAS